MRESQAGCAEMTGNACNKIKSQEDELMPSIYKHLPASVQRQAQWASDQWSRAYTQGASKTAQSPNKN